MNKTTIAEAWRPWKYPDRESCLLRLPGESPSGQRVWLRPVAASLPTLLEADAGRIAAWRNRNREAFFTWVTFTPGATLEWLRGVYANTPTDLLFMVEAEGFRPFGHMGLSNVDTAQSVCEFGRVVRGEPSPFPGAMTVATQVLLSWAMNAQHLRKVFLKVFETNRQAVALYERCGFRVKERFGLHRQERGGTIFWPRLSAGSSAVPDAYGLRMEVTGATQATPPGGRA